MKAMMLAAGLGTRLRPVTEKLPKPCVPFLGVPLGLFSTHLCQLMGVDDFVFNSFHLEKQLREGLSPYLSKNQIQFQFISDGPQILGSGGGLKNAQAFFENEDFLLLCNADEVLLPFQKESLIEFVESFKKTDALASLLVISHPEKAYASEGLKNFGGVWVKENREILGFGRSPLESYKEVFHYTGFCLLSKRIFSYLPPGESNILYDAVQAGIQQGELCLAHPIDAQWFETGNEEDFIHAHDEILKRWNSPQLWSIKTCLNRYSEVWANSHMQWSGHTPLDFHISELSPSTHPPSQWNFLLSKDCEWRKKKLNRCIVLGSSQNYTEPSYEGKILS